MSNAEILCMTTVARREMIITRVDVLTASNVKTKPWMVLTGIHFFISCKHYGLFQLVIGCALRSSMLREVTDECTDIMFFSLKLLS